METITTKAKPYLSVYLILKRENEVCLLKRKNTGFCDNQWGFISGHAEENESATRAMLREAKEEAGITPLDLEVAHILHNKTNRENLDIFFSATSWEGKLRNMEPSKCAGLEFFPLDQLPPNTIDYIKTVLEHTANSVIYNEMGWEAPTSLDSLH